MVKAENVTVTFKKGFLKKKLKALDGFNLSVNEGDIFALLGPNGAGKSTAMYCLLGLIRPDSGKVSVFGSMPSPGNAMFEKISYLPEEPHYHNYLTVEEAVTYYASLYGNGIGRIKVLEAIERVGLSDFRDLRLNKFSKGMAQKVGIAQCLIGNPRVVFLDEPTRGLDPIVVREFRDILVDMNNRGATIIINSHVLSEIEMICNRVAIMKKGKVLAEDELSKLKNMSLETYTVEIGGSGELPEYVRILGQKTDTMKGEIPADKLEEFVRFISRGNFKLHECSLKKLSLEDVFFRIVQGEA